MIVESIGTTLCRRERYDGWVWWEKVALVNTFLAWSWFGVLYERSAHWCEVEL